MEVDPASLDPELRTAKFLALASAALGLISLCAALVPICGGLASLAGLGLGLFSLQTERSRMAMAGVLLSVLGIITTIVYFVFLAYSKS